MATMADVISEARVLLQDSTAPYRYSDPELLIGANDALKIVRKLRPDLFFGKYKTAISDLALTDVFPIGAEYKVAIRDYVVAHGQLRDSEDVSNSRAAVFMGMFEKSVAGL